MYLHLGQNVVVPEEDVIGIFDLDNTTSSFITRKFLGNAQKTGQVESVSEDLPKSFIVCCDGSTRKVILSQLSPQTLLKRTESMKGIII
jgi:hypothetical protein